MYIIWKREEDRYLADRSEVVGMFMGTYQEADALIERLNAADPSVKGGLYPYWRSEPTVLTPRTIEEYIQGL